jgi:hypothetical protein
MKFLAISIVYTAFFSLIGFAVYFTNSATPLWALLLTPSINTSSGSSDKNKDT